MPGNICRNGTQETGRIEQSATPRTMYATPATTFAARFIGTPAMNLLRLDGTRIAGREIGVAQAASHLGIRPEAVTLGGEGIGEVRATVRSLEYLGADLVLRCAVGSETITVRADGKSDVAAGAQVALHWPPQAEHYFDSHALAKPSLQLRNKVIPVRVRETIASNDPNDKTIQGVSPGRRLKVHDISMIYLFGSPFVLSGGFWP